MTRLEKEREALVHLYEHAICSDYSRAPLASSETLLALIERVERGVGGGSGGYRRRDGAGHGGRADRGDGRPGACAARRGDDVSLFSRECDRKGDRMCLPCVHCAKGFEGWEMPEIVWYECDAHPSHANLRSFPFLNTKCPDRKLRGEP